MKNLYYVIAGLLLIIWGLLYWGYTAAGWIHFILVLALFIFLVRFLLDRRLNRNKNNSNH